MVRVERDEIEWVVRRWWGVDPEPGEDDGGFLRIPAEIGGELGPRTGDGPERSDDSVEHVERVRILATGGGSHR